MSTSGYKNWLADEYRKWIEALEESTVLDFKDHPMVKRMLGEVDRAMYYEFFPFHSSLIYTIDNIGRSKLEAISGSGLRMTYYAWEVLKKSPPAITEIGGGGGEFYAILRALGYQGDYYILDLPEVRAFQDRYLAEVSRQTGLLFPMKLRFEFCVSFYALGEFDDETKAWYVENVVKQCPHGYIVWNPHSGASAGIKFVCDVRDEVPALALGNKVLEW